MFRQVFLILLVATTGCGRSATTSEPATPDHHDVPITEADVKMPANYAEAVAGIKSYRDAIRTAIEAGTPEQAHRPLDELEIVLSKLPSISKESGVPKDHWETINTTGRELRELFNQLHSAIDEHRPPDFKAVAEPIDRAIAKLEEVNR